MNYDGLQKIQLPGRTVLSAREQLPGPHGAEDMVSLKDLHSGAILQNIMFRFELGKIYVGHTPLSNEIACYYQFGLSRSQTYIGSILLSVNPYRLIKDMYGNRAIEKYRDRIIGSQAPLVEMNKSVAHELSFYLPMF